LPRGRRGSQIPRLCLWPKNPNRSTLSARDFPVGLGSMVTSTRVPFDHAVRELAVLKFSQYHSLPFMCPPPQSSELPPCPASLSNNGSDVLLTGIVVQDLWIVQDVLWTWSLSIGLRGDLFCIKFREDLFNLLWTLPPKSCRISPVRWIGVRVPI